MENIGIKSKTLEQAMREPNFSFLDSLADYQDLQIINKESVLLLVQMRQLNEHISTLEKKRANADAKYKNNYREAYLKYENGAKNEQHRKLLAEMDCQELERELITYDVKIREFQRKVNSIKVELDVLKTIGFNVRQELNSL